MATCTDGMLCFCCAVGSGCHCSSTCSLCIGECLPCTLSLRAPVGSPSGQLPPFTESPCVQWSRPTHTADSFHPTHCSDGTFTVWTGEFGWGASQGDECVRVGVWEDGSVWVCVVAVLCACVSVLCLFTGECSLSPPSAAECPVHC